MYKVKVLGWRPFLSKGFWGVKRMGSLWERPPRRIWVMKGQGVLQAVPGTWENSGR